MFKGDKLFIFLMKILLIVMISLGNISAENYEKSIEEFEQNLNKVIEDFFSSRIMTDNEYEYFLFENFNQEELGSKPFLLNWEWTIPNHGDLKIVEKKDSEEKRLEFTRPIMNWHGKLKMELQKQAVGEIVLKVDLYWQDNILNQAFNPQIWNVTKLYDRNNEKAIKVFLKNGKEIFLGFKDNEYKLTDINTGDIHLEFVINVKENVFVVKVNGINQDSVGGYKSPFPLITEVDEIAVIEFSTTGTGGGKLFINKVQMYKRIN